MEAIVGSTGVTARAVLGAVSPFFIVSDLQRSLDFYRDELGFGVTFAGPETGPFFAIVERDGVQIMVKVVADGVGALPNRHRHPHARWDAFVYVADPDTLAAEFAGRDVDFSLPLSDTDDGLRGFELSDRDGYLLFFGRPR
jgi:catechol 2,3-dioxygenase-like lactoylglutathione lyase family enzyme